MRGGTKLLGDVSGKVGGVFVGLEADQVITGKRPQNPLMMRHRGNHLGRRHRDVEEETDLIMMAPRSQFLRQRHQMVVVHPDDVVGFEVPGQ